VRIFNILDYGAKYADVPQTQAIQTAIDDCFLAGGGRVLIPNGIYLTGGLRIRSGVELYLESGAILKGSRNPEDYFGFTQDVLEPVTMEEIGNTPATCRSAVSTSRWCNGLIRALDAHDFAVIGEKGSYIDGNNCFDALGEENYRGPHGMSFWRCENIRLEGYTFLHSSNWCHAIFQSKNITVRNIAVFGGHDGVDVRTCDQVLIEDCEFQCGDDAIAGFDNQDVIVRNCIVNSACQAFRFGGNNVLFENCRSEERPLRFPFRNALTAEEKKEGALTGDACRHEMIVCFSYYCDNRAVLRKPAENMVIKNCHFSQAREILRLEFDGLHRWCCNRSLRSIRFEDCSMGEIVRSGMLWGDENEKVTCHFKNVTIRAKDGFGKEPLFVAANFDKIIFEDCTIEGWEDPTILVASEGVVEQIRSTPVTVKKASCEECLEAHPWGVVPDDRKKNRRFL
jgi:polygalacturonase